MRKFVLFILLCLWVSSALLAGPVTQRRAMEIAARLAVDDASSQLDCKWAATESMPYYAFDIGEEKGFVLVAGDDRVSPILGYSDKGHFDWNEMPPALRAWLEAYGDHLSRTGDNENGEPMPSPSRVMEVPRNAIAPLLSTNWSQQEPYYSSCPYVGGEFCNTGCVATAMAQLIYYFRASCPKTLQAEIEGYTCTTNWPNYGYVSVPSVPEGTPIDFDHMLDNYMGRESEVEKKAVSDFMFYCAASIETEFVPPSTGSSSSANSYDIPSALKNYFGFSKDCCFKERSAYSIAQWEEMIYNEVKAGRPVVYRGRSENYSHAFLIDGYDGDMLYHVNWGWGGLYNGYYNLSVLSSVEGSTSNGFTMTQGALLGAQPAYEGDMLPTLSAYDYTLSGLTLGYTVANYTDGADDFMFGIAAVMEDETIHLLKRTAFYFSMPDRTTRPISLTLNKSDVNLPNGEYVLKPVYKRYSEETWRLADCSDEYLFHLSWDSSTPSLSLNSPSKGRIFTADAFSFPANAVKGARIPITATLTCSGGEYGETVYLFASTTSTASTYASRTGVYLKDGEQCEVTLSFTPSTTGKYKVWIATDTQGTMSIGGCTVDVSESSSNGELSVVGYQVDNAVKSGEWNTVYGKILKGTITLKNTGASLYSDIITLWLMKGSTKSYYQGSSSNKMLVTLAPGETMTMNYAYDEGETGKYYQLWLMKGNALITNGKVRFFQLVPGITTYEATGNSKSIAPNSVFNVPDAVCAVDLEGAGVTKLTPNGNPNTIYFLGESDVVPSGLSDNNLVKSGVAEKVTLADGHTFYTPRTFYANTISYTRTPQRQTSGKGGWETIVLPFAVQEVTNVTDNKTIDWFHSSVDSNKDFWLKEYALQDVETGVAYFDHVETFLPHIPYLIAVPSSKWGATHDLTGKQLRFSANGVEVTADARLLSRTSVYRFEGTYVERMVEDMFVLNEQGTSFVRTGSASLMPFRAFFAESNPSGTHANIIIGDFDEATSIKTLPAMEEETVDIHTLSGVKVRTVKVRNGNVDTEGLPKGIYLVRGKKIIVR